VPASVSVPLARRFGLWLAAAVLLAALLRAAQLAAIPDLGYFVKYTATADAILRGAAPAQRLADLSPGYLWFVTAVRGVLGPSVVAIRALQLALLAGTAWLCGWLAYRLVGPLAGGAAAAVLLLLQAPVVNAAEVEPETLLAAALAAALTILLDPCPPRIWRAAAGGLALGLASAVRPTVVPVALVLLAWVARTWRWRAGGLVAIGLAVPLAAAVGVNAALAGTAVVMNPGTVFYEGMNPSATGYLGEAPWVVKELEGRLPGPDALHEAYRQVAAAALGRAASPRATNRYWTTRAVTFATTFPGTAARLLLRKAWLAVHSYEAWDLLTMERKARLLARWPWLPFGALAALAGVGVGLRRRRPAVPVLAAAAAIPLALMTVFYVSSRQRCAALPALAVLAGLGIAALGEQWRAGRKVGAAVTAGLALLAAGVLGLDGTPQREDRHGWTAALAAAEARASANLTDDPALHRRLLATADVRAPWRAPQTSAAERRALVVEALAIETDPAVRFDLALAAARAGDWETAARVLAALDAAAYRPQRGSVAVASVAYYRARAALHSGRGADVSRLLARALAEAPGDPWVLALAAAADPVHRPALDTLAGLHDPLTVHLALARAAADLGDSGGAAHHVESAAAMLPALRQAVQTMVE